MFPPKQADDLHDQLSTEDGYWRDLQACAERGATAAEIGLVYISWMTRLVERRPERECLDTEAKDARSPVHPMMNGILRACGYGVTK